MRPGHLERILRGLGDDHLIEKLAALPPTDLQSLLLEISARQAKRVSIAQLLKRYGQDRFSKPAAADPRDIADFDRIAYQIASDMSPEFPPRSSCRPWPLLAPCPR